MSFRGRGGGRGGFGGGRGGRGGRGGGRGFQRDEGPPAEVVEAGTFRHECEGEAVVVLTNEKVPYFNAPIFLENKSQVGKVDEIFGQVKKSMFTIKMAEGIQAASYKEGDKFYIDPYKLLPMERFLGGGSGGGGRGGEGGRGGRGGGRGGARGGRGGGRGGGGRGGFGGRSPGRGSMATRGGISKPGARGARGGRGSLGGGGRGSLSGRK